MSQEPSPYDPRETCTPPVPATTEARSLKELSPSQWKSGIAAWLGWLFDGLDLHLYTLVATAFVTLLLGYSGALDADAKANVGEKAAWIQASFLIGWALGGTFFGRLGDMIGRSRALSLTTPWRKRKGP